MSRFFLIASWVLLFVVSAFAGDYRKVDEYAKRAGKEANYKLMAMKLAKPFATQKEKARAIYVWIAYNIRYDYAKYKGQRRRGGYRITGRNKKEIEKKRKLIRQKKINKVYRTGKGVCEDYSYLFQAMCRVAGIKTAYITGKIRVSPQRIGYFPKYNNHAWNAIQINGKWHLIDVTWAAGTIVNGRFKRRFTGDYFMADPRLFVLEHYPDNPKWQLLPKPLTKKQFATRVFVYSGFHDYGIKAFSPHYAYFDPAKRYATVNMQFKGRVPQIVMLNGGKVKKLKESRQGNTVKLTIPVYRKYNKDIILGVKKGRRFVPILHYKVKKHGRS